MSLKKEYPFDNSLNYTYDSNKIQISGGHARLLLDEAVVPYTITYATDAGIIYDTDEIEFISDRIQQKDQRPITAILGATFKDNLDLSWARFSNTVYTPIGTPQHLNGKLFCDDGNNGIFYDDSVIGNLGDTGTIEFDYTPNYNTAPSTNSGIVALRTTNQLSIFHSPSGGSLRLSTGTLSAVIIGAWSPVLGQDYKFTVQWDVATFGFRLYIDGVQIGSDIAITTRGTSSTSLYLGGGASYAYANGSFDNLIVYTDVQVPSANTVPDYTYIEGTATLPEIEHIGLGAIITINSFTDVSDNEPRYTIEIGRSGIYLYHDGVDWVASDGSYSQSSNALDVDNHTSTLHVLGETYGRIKIHFPDSNLVSSIEETNLLFLENSGYYQDNPIIEINEAFQSDSLINLIETSSKPLGTEIKYILKKDTIWYYHDGLDWVVSDKTYIQSNTAIEIQSNISSFVNTGSSIKVALFLGTTDNIQTPIMENLEINYDFYAGNGDLIEKCIVWLDAINILGKPVTNQKLTVTISQPNIQYKNSTMTIKTVETIIPDANGRLEVALVETDNMVSTTPIYYTFTINKQSYKKTVPNIISSSFWDLPNG